MGPEEWKRKLGDSAWGHLVANSVSITEVEIAELLDRVTEIGFMVPERPPIVDPRGMKVLWPSTVAGTVAVLTPSGLASYYERRGHGFFVLRVSQLLNGCGQLLLPRLQEVLAAYEN